jgi:uncharacterized phage-associated protein
MSYPALYIAKYFIKKAAAFNSEMTPMKLIKLVYIAHGWYLALANEPLIEEPVEAWQYGPVIDSIYQEYKMYGSKQIEEEINDKDISDIARDNNVKTLLEKIWDIYGKFTGIQLSNLTHEENSPWWQAIENSENIIDNEIIKEYYFAKRRSN